jgi:hypothetical protein
LAVNNFLAYWTSDFGTGTETSTPVRRYDSELGEPFQAIY